MSAVMCDACGQELHPLDQERPGFYYHDDGLLFCSEFFARA